MNHNVQSKRWVSLRTLVLLALLGGSVLSGCATTRGELDVRINSQESASDGPLVVITQVVDARTFHIAPPEPSMPSLKDDAIDNLAIKARAIGRKRNTFGKALGDILLPEGRTVELLAHEALVSAFRQAGYRVTNEGEPNADQAIPVEAQIDQFWAWSTPGFWAIKLEFETRMTVTSTVSPFEQGEEVRGYIRLRTQGASTSRWMNTVTKGLDDFIQNMVSRLKESKRVAAR